MTLDTFTIYLIAINVAAFVLFTVDFLVYLSTDRDGAFSHTALIVLAIIGGTYGTALAFLLWDRKTVKANALWHVLCLVSLVLWTLGLLVWRGPAGGDLLANLQGTHLLLMPLLVWLAIINVITFVAFLVDKRRAIRNDSRLSEGTLLVLAVLGGTPAGMLAMLVAWHKVHTPAFRVGLPLILLTQLILAAYLVWQGVL